MANDLRLQVLLAAMDKASAPLKRIDAASKGAATALRKTRDSLRALDQLQGEVGDFRKLKAGTRATETEMGQLQARIGELAGKIRTADGDVAKHTAELKRATRAAGQLKDKHQRETEQLQQLRTRLSAAGVDTARLGDAERRLRGDVAATTERMHQQTAALKAQAIQARNLAAIEKARNANLATRAAVGGKLLGTVAATAGVGYALSRVVGSGNEFESQLQLIGNTADMTGAQVAQLRERIMAASQATGQSATTVERALGFLVAAGQDTDTASRSIRTIGRTATAAGADIEDVSRAAFTLTDALNVRPEGLQRAMDMLAQAGKEGNVELRDMARSLPLFGAAFKSMKMEGPAAVATLGAALEIARKGAPDADAAATNMANYFQKILSPDTLKKAKKNFHIDLYQIIKDAQTSGGNPFEASMEAIIKATGGDQKRIGELFQDAQVQAFIRPMTQNWGEYQRIRDKALAANGVTDHDFAKMMDTAKQKLANARNAAERLGVVFARTLAPGITRAAEAIVPVLDRIAAFTQAHPHLVAGILGVVASLAGMRLALLGLRYAWTFLGGGMVTRAIGHLRTFAVGARAASIGARAAMVAITGISLPVLAVGAVLAAVALLVWKYWGPIKAFFIGVGQGISQVVGPAFAELGKVLAPLKPAWDAIASALGAVWRWLGQLLTPFHATTEQLAGATSAGVRFGRVLGAALGAVVTSITWVVKAFIGLGTALGTGAAMLTEAIKAPFAAAFKWITDKIDWIIEKWRKLKHAVGMGSDKPQPAGPALQWDTGDGTGVAPPPRIDNRPPVRLASAAPSVTHVGGIVIHAAPGQSPQEIAKAVDDRLAHHQRASAAAKRSALHDHE